MNVTEDRKELFKAISAAQAEFTTVEKSAENPHFKSKFAPLDSIIEMIRPILPKHGLSVVQFTDIADNGGGVVVETVITHESGQYISGRLFMPSSKQDAQGYGAALTYGRRYGLSAALGIVSDEDVDGNQSEQRPQQRQQAAKPTSAPIDPKDAEYIERIKTALHSKYGSTPEGKKSALDKVEELTSFIPKGKTEAERVKGVRNFTTLKGDRLKYLAHSAEKLAAESTPEMCNECRQTGTHSPSCPNAQPQD